MTDQATQIITQLKANAVHLAGGNLESAKLIYEWMSSETVETLVAKRLQQLGVEIVKE